MEKSSCEIVFETASDLTTFNREPIRTLQKYSLEQCAKADAFWIDKRQAKHHGLARIGSVWRFSSNQPSKWQAQFVSPDETAHARKVGVINL